MDLGDGRRADADLRDTGADLGDQLLALLSREHLRIADRADQADVGRDKACGGDHRTRERRHPHFVDADDAKQSFGPEAFLGVKRRHGD